jgi:hypothetical protein
MNDEQLMTALHYLKLSFFREHYQSLAQEAARFPLIKTLEQFDWSWPKKINRAQVQNLFRFAFLKDKANVIFLGGTQHGPYCYNWPYPS